ncbi:hypothetical protein SAMN05421759_1097 [Roseivivax lentus]|uniref:Uncharacterized protein n=1 Tax=Roseivivax lentus TaxID=633194 RepID=A0A1N7NM49_9RHOB|nr:hypothetical protein [Roseivivax lentus]SIS99308.1 hypothetical protein SAMN05421759_1097 [Roseivivax lentus]
MPRTYETATPTDSDAIRKERSGVIHQIERTPETLKRLRERQNENTSFEQERDHLRSEMGFQRHRQFVAAQAMDRIHALELQAINNFRLEDILAAKNKDVNQAMYEEICRIENSYINQLITLDNIPGADFSDQRGLSRINLIKFFLSKTELCYLKGEKLNSDNLDHHILSDTELRLNDIKKQIRQLFNEAREVGRNDEKTFQAFKADLAELTAQSTEQEAPLPDRAPELYKDREHRSEKPEAFLERVYVGLTGTSERPAKIVRSHIKAWDKSLYEALYKRRDKIENFDVLLPPSQGRSISDLSRSDAEIVTKQRSASREGMARLRSNTSP